MSEYLQQSINDLDVITGIADIWSEGKSKFWLGGIIIASALFHHTPFIRSSAARIGSLIKRRQPLSQPAGNFRLSRTACQMFIHLDLLYVYFKLCKAGLKYCQLPTIEVTKNSLERNC